MTTFEARYPGWCPACNEKIKVGDRILDDPLDGYVHEHCQVPERPERPPCPQCWLVHAGECM